MATKPSTKLNWVTSNDPTKVIEPTTLKKNGGWEALEKPPFQWFNWLFNITDQWLKYLETFTDEIDVALDDTISDLALLTDTVSDLGTDKLNAPTSGDAVDRILASATGGVTAWKTMAQVFKGGGGFTTKGQIPYANASGDPAMLAGNTTTTRKVLSMVGDGTLAGIPEWTDMEGGLKPVPASSSITGVSNRAYQYDLTAGPYNFTFPAGTTEFAISLNDAKNLGGVSKYLRLIPPAGQSIDDYAADDTVDLDWEGFSETFYRIAGESVIRWEKSALAIQQTDPIFLSSFTITPNSLPTHTYFKVSGINPLIANLRAGSNVYVHFQMGSNGADSSGFRTSAGVLEFYTGTVGSGTKVGQYAASGAWSFGAPTGAIDHTFTSNGKTLSIGSGSGSSLFANMYVYSGTSAEGLNLGSNNGAIKFWTGSFGSLETAIINTAGVWTIGTGTEVAAQPALVIRKANAVNNRIISGYDAATRGYIRINSAQTNLEFEGASDRRIKENIETIADALTKINALNPVSFTMKESGAADTGFIAQEFAEVFPEAVTKTDDGQGDTLPDDTAPWTMSNAILIPYLVKALKEQQVMMEKLNAQNEYLLARIEVLEGK